MEAVSSYCWSAINIIEIPLIMSTNVYGGQFSRVTVYNVGGWTAATTDIDCCWTDVRRIWRRR